MSSLALFKDKNMQSRKRPANEPLLENGPQTRKRPANEPLWENSLQSNTETKLCTPFCDTDCAFKGEHNNLILSLVTLRESSKSSLEEWKTFINAVKEMCDLNQPLEDPDPELSYPLLHWAATLGKVKAVKWLLQQNFITFIASLEGRLSRLPNVSNETVLFSAVRYLHEGIKTRETYHICNVFARLLGVFLKHDPRVMLVQEGCTNDTVLHLCARGERGSNAPFYGYLRRILGTLHESYKEKARLPIRDILKRKNDEGDTFLHVLAKSDNKDEARSLINFAKEKFSGWKFLKLKNAEGKTAHEILKDIKVNSEVFEINCEESTDSEDDVPLRDLLDRKPKVQSCTPSKSVSLPFVTGDNRAHSSVSDEYSTGKQTTKPDNVLCFKRKPTVAAYAQSGDKSKEITAGCLENRDHPRRFPCPDEDLTNQACSQGVEHEDIPRLPFTGSVTDETNFHSIPSHLQQLDPDVRGFRRLNALLVEEPIDFLGNVSCDAETGGPVVSETPAYLPCATQEGKFKADTLNKAKKLVEKLIYETEMELLKDVGQLEESKRAVAECEECMRRLREERNEKQTAVERSKELVEAKVNLLNSYKEFMTKLV